MVIPSFVKQALAGEPITVYGNGQQRRCFGYVGDAVEALMRITTSPSVQGEVLNIGNDQEISILGLAEMIRARTHSSSEIIRMPYDEAYGPGFEDILARAVG